MVPRAEPGRNFDEVLRVLDSTRVFENEVGHHELVRVDGDRAHYRFTNRQGKTSEADMPLATWRRVTCSLSENTG